MGELGEEEEEEVEAEEHHHAPGAALELPKSPLSPEAWLVLAPESSSLPPSHPRPNQTH